jgi:hypothetical protein
LPSSEVAMNSLPPRCCLHHAYPARRATNPGAFVGTLVPESAAAARLRNHELRVVHERRTTSMTALQDWLSNRPVDPRNIKALICDAVRGLATDERERRPEPTVMGRGLERC